MKRPTLLLMAVVLGFASLFVPVLRGHADETRLLRLVSDDAGLCIEARDLKKHVTAWLTSESAARFRELSFYRMWRGSDEFKKIAAVRGVLQSVLGQPPEEWAGQMFGRSMVFALYAREQSGPVGVLLIEAETADVVQTTIAAWNRAEQQQTVELNYGESNYFSRTPLRGGKTDKRMFYWVEGNVLAIAEDKEMIHRVIDLNRSRNSGENNKAPLADAASYRQAIDALSDETIVSLYFNPHVWDRSGLEEKPDQFVPLFDLLRRLNSAVVGVRWNQGLIVEAVLHHEPPSSAGGFWSELASETADWPAAAQQAPADTLLLIAGSNEWALLLRAIANMPEVLKQKDVQEFRTALKTLLLGRDLFDDVLPLLPPSWGVFVVSHENAPHEESPFQAMWLLALPVEQASSSAGADDHGVRRPLDNLLRTSANLLAVYLNLSAHPAEMLTMHAGTSGSASLVWLDRVAGYQPAYAITERHLWISSSLDLLKSRLNASTGEHHQLRDEWRAWSDEYFDAADMLVLLRLAKLREALGTHREQLLDLATAHEPDRREDVAAKLAGLKELLGLADGVFFTADWSAEETRLAAGVVLHE